MPTWEHKGGGQALKYGTLTWACTGGGQAHKHAGTLTGLLDSQANRPASWIPEGGFQWIYMWLELPSTVAPVQESDQAVCNSFGEFPNYWGIVHRTAIFRHFDWPFEKRWAQRAEQSVAGSLIGLRLAKWPHMFVQGGNNGRFIPKEPLYLCYLWTIIKIRKGVSFIWCMWVLHTLALHYCVP